MNESTQLDVLDYIEVMASRGDPETSHEAAAELAADQTKLQRSVQTVIAILADHPQINDFQIRDFWPVYWAAPFSYTLPCKARHWARQAGRVRHDGFGKHQNRRVRLWSLGPDAEFLRAQTEACPCCNGTGRKTPP